MRLKKLCPFLKKSLYSSMDLSRISVFFITIIKNIFKATGTIKIKTNTDPRQPIKKDTVTRNTIIKTTTVKEKDTSTNNWQSLGHTELSSTKRSPTPIELLLSTPLTCK